MFFSFGDSQAENTALKAEIQMYQSNLKQLERLNQVLRDEYQSLNLAFAALEDKLRKTQVFK